MKLLLLSALIGHILCGISDCLLTYSLGGKVSLKDFKDYDKMKNSFCEMSLKQINIAIILGFIAMPLELFGYLAVCNLVNPSASVLYWIMLISVMVIFTSIPLHHTICCLCEWFFIRLGKTEKALNSVYDFFKSTAFTMYAGYLAIIVFSIVFIISVATGQTSLPRWAWLYNYLIFGLITLPTKIPAKTNVIGAVIFFGLLFVV